MQHRWKLAVAPLTFLPLIWACVCAVRVGQWWTEPPFVVDDVMVGGDAVQITSAYFAFLVKGTVVAGLFTLLMTVLLLLDAASSPRVPAEQRGLWCVVLVVSFGLAMPAYWWFNMRPGLVAEPQRHAAPLAQAL